MNATLLAGPPALPDPWGLGERQLRLMWSQLHGLSVAQAARREGIAAKTADYYMHDARRRMGLTLRGTHLIAYDRWLRSMGLAPITSQGPWDVTEGQSLLLDTYCAVGCHKLTARRLRVAESTVRKQMEYIRARMYMVGTPSIVPVLMWDRWRNPDGCDPV